MKTITYFVASALVGVLTSATMADTERAYHFDVPYQCDRAREVTSSRTGEVRTVYYRSIYSPADNWRIDLTDVGGDKSAMRGVGIANMHTATVRYDGFYREEGDEISTIQMGTTWPRAEPIADFIAVRSADDDINRCRVLREEEIAFYQFDYLGTLEIMGQ